MTNSSEIKHNLLLIIASLLFIIFITGSSVPTRIPVQPLMV